MISRSEAAFCGEGPACPPTDMRQKRYAAKTTWDNKKARLHLQTGVCESIAAGATRYSVAVVRMEKYP